MMKTLNLTNATVSAEDNGIIINDTVKLNRKLHFTAALCSTVTTVIIFFNNGFSSGYYAYAIFCFFVFLWLLYWVNGHKFDYKNHYQGDEILSVLIVRNVFNVKQVALELRNGKRRKLSFVRTDQEEQLNFFFRNCAIPVLDLK